VLQNFCVQTTRRHTPQDQNRIAILNSLFLWFAAKIMRSPCKEEIELGAVLHCTSEFTALGPRIFHLPVDL
jgi:hypothetical protein